MEILNPQGCMFRHTASYLKVGISITSRRLRRLDGQRLYTYWG